MYAYDEMYLDDAMENLAETLDYAVNALDYDIDKFFTMFCNSTIVKNFENGNPKYVTGMSGIELAWHILLEVTGQCDYFIPKRTIDRSREYWTGWVMAYYQHNKNISFKRMMEYGLKPSVICKRYLLHEADITKFIKVADEIILNEKEDSENRLRRFRKYAQLTQKELSEKSGVSLRMIQLYEQGQNDIGKAQFNVVLALSKTLKCSVEDLV